MPTVISDKVLSEIIGAFGKAEQRPSEQAFEELARAAGVTPKSVKDDYANASGDSFGPTGFSEG